MVLGGKHAPLYRETFAELCASAATLTPNPSPKQTPIPTPTPTLALAPALAPTLTRCVAAMRAARAHAPALLSLCEITAYRSASRCVETGPARGWPARPKRLIGRGWPELEA